MLVEALGNLGAKTKDVKPSPAITRYDNYTLNLVWCNFHSVKDSLGLGYVKGLLGSQSVRI